MKVWIIVIKASDDEEADGVTDELCSGQVYRRLDRAKKECQTILKDETDIDDAVIRWGLVDENKVGYDESDRKSPARWVGIPRDADFTFELHQAEVV